jgi:hypothetical protein
VIIGHGQPQFVADNSVLISPGNIIYRSALSFSKEHLACGIRRFLCADHSNMGEELDEQQSDLIVESTGLDHEQIDSLKKGFDGFDKVSNDGLWTFQLSSYTYH